MTNHVSARTLEELDVVWANAKVERVAVGSSYHDGRGFFTIVFSGSSWGQGITPAFTTEMIDNIIRVCAGRDLCSLANKTLRVGRVKGRGMIVALAPLLKDDRCICLDSELLAAVERAR